MINSQFNYCSLVWMFCSRQTNNLVNKIYKRPLKISHKAQKTSYQNLLETHNKLTNSSKKFASINEINL